MLHSWKRCLLILTPPLTLLIILILVLVSSLVSSSQNNSSQGEREEVASELKAEARSLTLASSSTFNPTLSWNQTLNLTSSSSPGPGPSSTSMNLAQQQQQQHNSYYQTPIDIHLNKNNFLLYNRCSSRVSIKISKRNRKALLNAKQQLFGESQSAALNSKFTSNKLKLLSTIISVESTRDSSVSREKAIGESENSGAMTRTALASKEDNSQRLQEFGQTSSKQWAASGRIHNPVRLRANLTELYICFDDFGKLEARVNGNSSNCEFNELAIDHRYVKYQSAHNSSWYIGFDQTGDPISGLNLIDKSGTNSAMRQEQCYQFKKLKQLRTTVQFFPEVVNFNDAFNKSIKRQQFKEDLLMRSKLKENEQNLTSNPIKTSNNNNNNNDNNMELLSVLERFKSPPEVLVYQQEQLINMARYRNILRYQLGLTRTQPIVSMQTNGASGSGNSNSTRATSLANKKRLSNKSSGGGSGLGKPMSRPEAKSRRAATGRVSVASQRQQLVSDINYNNGGLLADDQKRILIPRVIV